MFPPRGNKCFSLEVAKLSVIQMGKDLNIQVMELGHAYPKLVKNLTILVCSLAVYKDYVFDVDIGIFNYFMNKIGVDFHFFVKKHYLFKKKCLSLYTN